MAKIGTNSMIIMISIYPPSCWAEFWDISQMTQRVGEKNTNLKQCVICNNQHRLLVLRRSHEGEAVRDVSVLPGRRWVSNFSPLCTKASNLHPQESQTGVTSLIASTVFSFVDREACLEETDPVVNCPTWSSLFAFLCWSSIIVLCYWP